MEHIYYYHTDIGVIGIVDYESDEKAKEKKSVITHILLEQMPIPLTYLEKETSVIQNMAEQIQEYIAGLRYTFDIPYELQGTPFQQKVWNALTKIPYGETRSYKEIAIQTGNEHASRAIGMANHKNPLPILIPCHRVIGANGALVGYGGGLQMKKILLDIEATHIRNQIKEEYDNDRNQGFNKDI
ncbi:MAG: methylated-DNA--[protein]-cysteine S-methyltransferase [Lachnospiraceae bacterium]